MVPFLKLVVEDLKRKNENLAGFTVIFPNNRARLFFNEYLMGEADTPMWSPSYMTIQDLFQSCSTMQVADDTKLICDLFKVYAKHIDWDALGTEPETMDDFYFWGEIILSDFQDVDNNLVDAEQLFHNISELASYEDNWDEILTPEQKEALKHFFAHFTPGNDSLLKRKFAALWNALYPIYKDFRDLLRSQDIAYGGMLHREVVEHLDMAHFPSKKYVFVGFNVLNKCEIELFKRLNDAKKACFYWDTDDFYMEMQGVQHEAATFMKRNVEMFKNELDRDLLNEFTANPKQFTVISSATNNAQAKYLSKYLTSQKEGGASDADMAVVLCDESLLLPSLHAIPENVEQLNVTMGMPLVQTPVFSLLKTLIEMRSILAVYGSRTTTVPLRFIKDTLVNPYVRIVFSGANEFFDEIVKNNTFYPKIDDLVAASEDMKLLFSFLREEGQSNTLSMLEWLADILKRVGIQYKDTQSNPKEAYSVAIYNPLYKEALFRSYTIVNRLISLVKSGDLEVNIQTMCKLLERMLSATSVPFSGEPVMGMQIMGFLETRNLDFKHVVMLSVNEGVLPKASGDSSFIPYSLKKGFGLTTLEHKNSLYAYYFYRLLHRAEEVTFLYSSSTTGGSKGQMSRFLLQLMVEAEKNVAIVKKDLRSEIKVAREDSFEVVKSQEMIDYLKNKYDLNRGGKSMISPSMLNTYLLCPMKFYFSYVEGLREPEDLEDSVDHRILGLIVHKVMENIYNACGKSVVGKEIIEAWSKDEVMLEREVDKAFASEFFHHEGCDYTGQQLLMKMTALTYVKNALMMDIQMAPFTIVGGEQTKKLQFEVDGSLFNLGGVIDRLQKSDAGYQVVDYKTGYVPKTNKYIIKGGGKKSKDEDGSSGFEQLFQPSSDRKYLAYAMQVWLYSYICYQETGESVIPYLMFVSSKKGLINPRKEADELWLSSSNAATICGEIEENLRSLLREMFSMEQPFRKCKDQAACVYCPFSEICRGKKISK